MTREELLALPPSMALSILLTAIADELPGVMDRIERREAPRQPRPPKFDFRIRRKGGYAWASETDLDGLRFWCGKYKESASQGGQYADKDEKNAQKLSYWIEWRQACPKEPWTGQRNDDVVTAAVPSHKPRIYEWEAKPEEPKPSAAAGYDDAGDPDDIPFAYCDADREGERWWPWNR